MSALGITRGNTRIGALTGNDIAALTNFITQELDARRSAHYTVHEIVMTTLDDAVARCIERREYPTVRALVDAGTIEPEAARAATAESLSNMEDRLSEVVRAVMNTTTCGYETTEPDSQIKWTCTRPLGHGGPHDTA